MEGRRGKRRRSSSSAGDGGSDIKCLISCWITTSVHSGTQMGYNANLLFYLCFSLLRLLFERPHELSLLPITTTFNSFHSVNFFFSRLYYLPPTTVPTSIVAWSRPPPLHFFMCANHTHHSFLFSHSPGCRAVVDAYYCGSSLWLICCWLLNRHRHCLMPARAVRLLLLSRQFTYFAVGASGPNGQTSTQLWALTHSSTVSQLSAHSHCTLYTVQCAFFPVRQTLFCCRCSFSNLGSCPPPFALVVWVLLFWNNSFSLTFVHCSVSTSFSTFSAGSAAFFTRANLAVA